MARSMGLFAEILICVISVTVSTTIDWRYDSSVSNVHCSDRLTTIEAQTVAKCAVECRAVSTCVSVGYSTVNRQCQLYHMNIADFTTGLISQPSTDIYRAVCSNTDYTLVRQLNLCYRVNTTPLNFNDAYTSCQADEATLLGISDSWLQQTTASDALTYMGGSPYLVYGVIQNATHVQTGAGTNQIEPIDNIAWRSGEPNMTHVCVVVYSGSGQVEFGTWDCNLPAQSFCGYTAAV